MVDHNEVFNTGYVEGDGGVMYTGASLTNGYGMQVSPLCCFRANHLIILIK